MLFEAQIKENISYQMNTENLNYIGTIARVLHYPGMQQVKSPSQFWGFNVPTLCLGYEVCHRGGLQINLDPVGIFNVQRLDSSNWPEHCVDPATGCYTRLESAPMRCACFAWSLSPKIPPHRHTAC